MNVRSRGTTFIEILIAMLVGAGLLVFVSQILPRTLRANRVNEQATDVNQNAAVVAALLMLDVKDAGFRGGTEASFDICDTCSPTSDQVGNLLDIVKWPFTLDASGALSAGLLGIPNISGITDDPLPILTHVPGTGSNPDALGFVRVLEIDDATSDVADIYDAEFVLYTVDTTDEELVRLRQDLTCDGTFVTTGAGSECRLDGGNSGQQPAVEGIEDIQFFFKLRNEVGGQPVYTSTLPSNVSSVASVGVYTRARSNISDPNFTDTASYPASDLLPTGNLVGGMALSNWSQLGITTTGPFNDTFRRIEKVQEIALRTTPACNLLPIGWPAAAIPSTAGSPTSVTFTTSTPGPGNFGWLSWEGSNSVPTLVRSINYPNLVSSTYRDPTDTSDTTLDAGGFVEGMPGNKQPGASALSQYIGIPIVVPLYGATSGTGSNLNYEISGFASIVLDGTSTITSLSGTYLGEASVTCTL
ncbi:MAG: hypothetical protein AB4050_15330 [Synechococcus sp.]